MYSFSIGSSILGSIFALAWIALPIALTIYVVVLLGRLTSANERMADQLDYIARSLAAIARKNDP